MHNGALDNREVRRKSLPRSFAHAGELRDGVKITLQRYLMKYLVKAPFPVREIGTVMTLLHACHVP